MSSCIATFVPTNQDNDLIGWLVLYFDIAFTFPHLVVILAVCRLATFLLKNRVGSQPQLRVVPVGIDPQLRRRLVLVLDDDVETVLREGMTVPRQSVEAGHKRWMGKGWVVGRVLTRGGG